MTIYNHTPIVNNDARKNDAAIWNDPLGELDAAMGDLASLTTTATSLATAINELDSALQGGADVGEQLLKNWALSEAYELTAVNVDADEVVTTATVKWPDGSAGTFTTTTKNATWLAVDAYTISHTDSGQTVTQALVTRNANGTVTVKPALTVA